MSKLSKKLKENLATEIDILKGLKHPHIVQLFVCTETPAYIYLVMEYCQLSDLAQFMKKRHQLPKYPETAEIFRKYPNPENGGLHEVLARHFAKQIVSALQYLRAGNLIHRDIKPQNLLLNPAPTYMSKLKPEDVPLAASEHSLSPAVGVASLPMLKIADFGFARHLPSTSMAETLCGSPLYMAPEILRYEKYDARADLWSTGTVMYEIVVGKPPFRAQNHVDLLRKIEKAEDVIIFDKSLVVSRPMKNLIRALLKKSPVERMTYEDLFNDPLVNEEIPGLAPEDHEHEKAFSAESSHISELSQRIADAKIAEPRRSPAMEIRPRKSQDVAVGSSSRGQSSQNVVPSSVDDPGRRRSSPTPQNRPEAQIPSKPQSIPNRRPSIVAHITAPGRQELLHGQSSNPPGQRIERRPSRSSPLAAPPLIREPTFEEKRDKEERAAREAREQTAQDLKFEREYVVIEKRAVEVNALADELDAKANVHGRSLPTYTGAMARRATTHGQPGSLTSAQPASPSRAIQVATGRPYHQRGGSFERRYALPPQSTANMLSKALNAANVRLFGAFGTSPPFGKGASPPRGYGAFPAYPSSQPPLAIGDGTDPNVPMDEDQKLVRVMEDAAHRSNVIFDFAEVKYKQLLPATPSAQDALGIQQIGGPDNMISGSKDEDDDKDMTNLATVGVAEEALVLYVKALAILTKTIDLAGHWWSKQNRGEALPADVSPTGSPPVGTRIVAVVRWSRARFNDCLEKSEVVGRKLQQAQRQLPEDHPGHPSNHAATSTSSSSGVTTSAEHIRITSGITAERLMFDRAVEMSRSSAVDELLGGDLSSCELNYATAIMLLEAVLEVDSEPLMKIGRKDKEREEAAPVINGMEAEDRQTVIKREYHEKANNPRRKS